MRLGRPLPRRFFARTATLVARELVGCVLLRTLSDGRRLAARLVEVEAYLGDGSDPSAHGHRGRTALNASMFGPPGRLYAYRSYGIHTCVNVVCEPDGVAAAVLLRAAEPLEGVATMRRWRGLGEAADLRQVARGPGRLASAFGLGIEHDGASVLAGELQLRAPATGSPRPCVVAGPRVGISRAADLPYRFYADGDRFVSAFRPGRRARPARV